MLPPVRSPEVHPDGRVTFRLRAPNARTVLLAREGAEPVAMSRGDGDVWEITLGPLEPDFYGYSFLVDGVGVLDPANPLFKPNLLNTQNLVHVPGPSSLPWEAGDVPRGTVHRHFYRSAVVGGERDFYVYTPPGYDPAARRTYPVLYLLHGFSDDASAWITVGRAHVILDNLIARGDAVPMIVAMPLGYGVPELPGRGWGALADATLRARNLERFRDVLLREIVPAVERTYRVDARRETRAIAGLSMGGAQALAIGLNALDRFGWIGAFSTGGLDEDFDRVFAGLDAGAAARLGRLWIACGTEDRLIGASRRLRAWLASKGIRHDGVETPGGHTWMVWRRNLAAFLPLLFR
ncbi:MAG TPA: alpha/beta hydrolase-fold protein [Vicinamibacterales bacterium]|nr:alpha/beta hydrolase-fold protein [Vicinamibacterales bacterium]